MDKDYSIKVKGMSITMRNWNFNYKRWTVLQKQKAIAAMQSSLNQWARVVASKASMYAPEYSNAPNNGGQGGNSNSLANSIMVSPPEMVYGGRKSTVTVGVKSGWHSQFDDDFMEKRGKLPPWGVSSDQLAVFIHDNWDSVVGEQGRQRAHEKARRHGLNSNQVGERFLARAVEDTKRNVDKVFSATLKSTFIDGKIPAYRFSNGGTAESINERII